MRAVFAPIRVIQVCVGVGAATNFRTLVRADLVGRAARSGQVGEPVGPVHRPGLPRHPDGQSLACGFIDEAGHPEVASLVRAVLDAFLRAGGPPGRDADDSDAA